MNVEQFFHICRSAAAIANVSEVTVFGAAAVVPWIDRDRPGAPPWPSMELDIDPGGEANALLVDGSIGEGSLFEETFGIHAHGISIDAFIAPPDWRSRAVEWTEPASGVRIIVPHPQDLTVAKLLRGDERDREFAAYCSRHLGVSTEGIAHGLVSVKESRPDYAAAAEMALVALPGCIGPD